MRETRPAIDERATVLIVDDHEMFREFLATFIEREDMRVVAIAADAKAAYDAALEHRPDIVLMDQLLPDGPGTEVLAKIKAALPRTKIIMLTGSGDDEVLLDALAAGCSGFVLKASAPSEVLAAIRATSAGVAVLPDRVSTLLAKRRAPSASASFDLTSRESEVLTLLAHGQTTRGIAAELFISPNTVRNHVQRVITKLGAHSKLEAVATAVRARVVKVA